MTMVRLHSEIDFTGWREAARNLRLAGVAPEDVEWAVGADQRVGFAEPDTAAFEHQDVHPFSASRDFLVLAQAVVCHRDPGRFDRLYRLAWRLKDEPRLLESAKDAEVAEVRGLAAEVARGCQRMKAFLRFRLVDEEPETYAAWYEPPHRILERTAPFFARRFSSLRFMILTPEATCGWDGSTLRFTGPQSWNPARARFIPDLTD